MQGTVIERRGDREDQGLRDLGLRDRGVGERYGIMGQSFKDLLAWQRAIQLTVAVYALTSKFPEAERFGLTNQTRRASVSVASNIAEGYGRLTKGEYIQFFGYARGFCSEVETQICIAKALAFGRSDDLSSTESLCNDVGRLLGGLIRSQRERRCLVPAFSVPQSLSKESVAL